MKRLNQQNLNTAEEYNKIFKDRANQGISQQDLRRWQLLLRYYKGGKILDIGCLDSRIPFIVKISHSNAEIWGIDIANEALKKMKEKYGFVNYELRDLYDTKFEDKYFDYVVMGEILEHLEEPEKGIKEAMRILKNGGTLALSTPLNEIREKGAVDAEHHLWSFDIQDILKMLKPYSSIRIKTMGSEYLPKYIYHFPIILAYCKKK